MASVSHIHYRYRNGVEYYSASRAANAVKEAARSILTLEIASRIVRAHSYFVVDNFDQAFEVLNGKRFSNYEFGEFAFPVLIHNLIEKSDSASLQLKSTLRDAVEIASLEGALTSIPNQIEIDRYRTIWCRIISQSTWAELIPDADKGLHGSC